MPHSLNFPREDFIVFRTAIKIVSLKFLSFLHCSSMLYFDYIPVKINQEVCKILKSIKVWQYIYIYQLYAYAYIQPHNIRTLMIVS